MLSVRKLLFICCVFVCGVSFVKAQQTECIAPVTEAVEQVDLNCSTLSRNEVCYGNAQIDATFHEDASDVSFEVPGDVTSVTTIERMSLSGFDETSSDWGIALMRLQANLPDTLPGQNVNVVLFGDVELESDDRTLNSFFFEGGIGRASCEAAPDGLLIQTPEGDVEVQLTINDVQIRLGSTAYLAAAPDDAMIFALLDGSATLTVGDESVMLAGGEFSTIPLDENLSASDVPAVPQAYTDDDSGDFQLPDLPDLPFMPYPIAPLELPDLPEEATDETTPISGTYSYTFGPIGYEGSCSSEVVETSADLAAQGFFGYGDNIEGNPAEFDFSTGTFLETVYGPETGGEFEVDFANPETNVYTVEMTIYDMTTVFTYRVVSETRIVGQMEQPHPFEEGCITVAPIEYELQQE